MQSERHYTYLWVGYSLVIAYVIGSLVYLFAYREWPTDTSEEEKQLELWREKIQKLRPERTDKAKKKDKEIAIPKNERNLLKELKIR